MRMRVQAGKSGGIQNIGGIASQMSYAVKIAGNIRENTCNVDFELLPGSLV